LVVFQKNKTYSESDSSTINKIQDTNIGKTKNATFVQDRNSLGFWFKRSDFYVTGLNFVCSRIAIMT
jgi:hypothetical protein